MAVTILAEDGLGELSLGRVARDLGVSHGVMSKRYGDLDDLLCDLWIHVGLAQIDRTLAWIFEEVERIGDPDSRSTPVVEPTIFRKTK